MNLVIGATGIVGSHVVLKLLQKNEEVIATKQPTSDLKKVKELFSYYTSDSEHLFTKIKWVDMDIKDIYSIEEALNGVNTVYHCAGLVSFNNKKALQLKEVNETGTRNVVNACLQMKIGALCYVSSIATLNNLDVSLPITEDVFWKRSGKESNYAISKYNAEREVWRGIEEGLNAVIVNPGVILSPVFWKQSSSQIFERCAKGNKYYTNGIAAYISAFDVSDCMIKLVQKQQFGNRYILINENIPYKKFLTLVQQNLKVKTPSIMVSKHVLRFVSFLESIYCFLTQKEKKLTASIRNSLFNQQVYSNQKVKNTLNFQFQSLEPTIEEICRYYLLSNRAGSSTR